MTDVRDLALRFKELREKRKATALESGEEAEFQRLGKHLMALRQSRAKTSRGLPENKVIGDGDQLRGHPLPGCDFFDDFPELYRHEVFGSRRRQPPLEDEILARGLGTVRLRGGKQVQGPVVVDERITVAGEILPRSQVMEVVISKPSGAKRGQGISLTLNDGRKMEGYLVSSEDEDFFDLLPLVGQDQDQTRWLIRRSEVAEQRQWN